MNPVIIIGHRNPDMDSVASAISYNALKHLTGEDNYVAAVAGELNRESSYVLERLGIEQPLLIQDVRARVEDLLDPLRDMTVLPSATLQEAGKLVKVHDQKTIPVTDPSNRLLGLLTVGDIAATFMDRLSAEFDDDQARQRISEVLNTRVAKIMRTDGLIIFERSDPVDEARQTMLKTRYRNYPVIDEDNLFLGMISRYHLLRMKRKQLVLVDHNEKKQAVEGIEEAEILEVIDHHRVGDIESINPIYFRNEPVGATCTLVSLAYREKGYNPSPSIAGLMLAGIMSDTMIFRSPTTTAVDREIANWLSGISGLNMEEWGRSIFKVASPTDGVDPALLIAEDLKEYTFGRINFAVSQIETADMASLIGESTHAMQNAMEEYAHQHGYNLFFVMLTDIFAGGSHILVAGEKKGIGSSIFGAPDTCEIFLPGVMSRKKQVIPVVFRALARQEEMSF